MHRERANYTQPGHADRCTFFPREVLMRIVMIITLLGGIASAAVPDMGLSGIVKKRGGDGIQGATVSLAQWTEVTETTGTNGSFSIVRSTGAQPRTAEPGTVPPRFRLRNGFLEFSPASPDAVGSMALFSGNGKRIASVRFGGTAASGDRSVKLPELGSGIYIVSVHVDGVISTRTLVSMGGDCFLEDRGGEGRGRLTLAKRKAGGAPVDTLVATMEGYDTAKLPIESYFEEDLEILMDSVHGGGLCTRKALDSIAETYVAALETGDPGTMDLTEDAKYFENMKSCPFDSGIWKKRLKINHHRNFIDVDSCKVFVEIVDHESENFCEIGAQLLIEEKKIRQIDAIIVTVDDWGIYRKSDLKKIYDITTGEKWTVIPEEQRDDREVIKAAGDAYLDCFLDSTKVTVPWGIPCARQEGSMYTGIVGNYEAQNTTCNAGVPQNLRITDRQYVIDVEMGSVSIFCKFGGGMPDSHLFRVEKGKLRFVHTMSYCEVRGCPM